MLRITKKGVFILMAMLVFPTLAIAQVKSTNYQLKDYSFGTSGQKGASANYQINGTAGSQTAPEAKSTNYQNGDGLSFDIKANVPPAPTLLDQNRNYNKLHLTLNNGNNPSDTKFLVSISTDDFATINDYVQNDGTIGTAPVSSDWQTYSGWGGSSGSDIIGLTSNTTYTVKVSAMQSNFTQSEYGPTAQATTANNSLSFSLSPNSVNIGTLTPGSVTTAPTTVTVNLDTNAASGGSVWIYDSNNGLLSSTSGHTISAGSPSSQNNLTAVTEGYGLQASSPTQSSGGPIELFSPYNGSGNNVGALGAAGSVMADSSNAPVISGSWSFNLQAKASNTTPSASDYADVLTLVATADF